MTTYAVKRNLKGISMQDLGNAQKAAISTSEKSTQNGTPVKYIRSNFYPGDGSCTCLFEADSAADVEKVNKDASLPFDKIEEVLDLNP